MTAAIFGLIGVLVGGFIAFAADLVIERRKEKAELRATARLLILDLDHAALALVMMTFFDMSVNPILGSADPTRRFHEADDLFARWLDDDTWQILTLAVNSLDRLPEEQAHRHKNVSPSRRNMTDPHERNSLEHAASLVGDASERLQRLAQYSRRRRNVERLHPNPRTRYTEMFAEANEESPFGPAFPEDSAGEEGGPGQPRSGVKSHEVV